jgi:diketogulonate reductase-like aldo/keto reductase
MRTVTLNNGVERPLLGFGVYRIPAEHTQRAVSEALAAGYRLLDTAAYGNEEAVGRAIKSSSIPREDLFVTTKLGVRPFGDVYGQWHAMEALNREGAAKAIGVADFSPDRLIDLIVNNEITPQVNQIETHPFSQRVGYQDLMREGGEQIRSWGGFAEGENDLFTNPLLAEIGKEYGKAVAQVVLRRPR